MEDVLNLAGTSYRSRLIVGTGKYKDFQETKKAIEVSGAEIVTVAVRRVNITDPNKENLLDYLDPKKHTILPNTAGCYTAEDAVRTCRLAREAGVGKMIKLEVIGDDKTLFPDIPATLDAARILVKEGFVVLPYITDDPITAKKLQDIGCAAVMPLAAPIGSGLGHSQPVQHSHHPGTGNRSGYRRRRCRNRVGCCDRHGDGLRWRFDEYRHCQREGSDLDGRSDATGSGIGPKGLFGRAHTQEALRHRLEPSRRHPGLKPDA